MWFRRAVATAWVVCLSIICWDLVPRKAQADLQPRARHTPAWTAPDWHPAPEALHAIPAMDTHGPDAGPRLKSRAAFVFDVESGEVLLAHGADEVRPVASLTKLMSALTLVSVDHDLEQTACVDMRFYPTRSGARSKLSTGECYQGWDLLGAALVASDNRAAFGLHVLAGLGYAGFIERMNEASQELGMGLSSWADPSGLEDENLSTARDMARAALAVAAHPELSVAATAPSWRIERAIEAETERLRTPDHRELRSTNRLLANDDLDVLSGKTGYTDTAGYCFAGVVRSEGGRLLAVSVLGAGRSPWRWRDLSTLLAWADQ